MQHEARISNKVADKLAKEGHKLSLTRLFVTWTDPPVFVRQLMKADIRVLSIIVPVVTSRYNNCTMMHYKVFFV